MTLLTLALFLVACKRDDPDGNGVFGALPDAQVTFLSEGDGPENTAPLEPIRVGHRASTPDTAWTRWSGSLDAGRDDVFVKEGWHWAFGQGVGLYRATDDGLVVHALDAPLDEETLPVLMVPNTVRIGMEWESEYGDGDVNRMQVTAHQTIMLPTGPAEAWAIAEFSDVYGQIVVVATRWYAEGIGRIGQADAETVWSPVFGYEEMVFPTEEQDHVEPALDPQPLIGAVPIDEHGEAGHEVWGLSGAVIDGVLWGYMDGEDPAIGYTLAAPHDYCARLDSPPQWVAAGGPGCPTHTVLVLDPFTQLTTESQALVHASMILPGLDTTVEVDAAGAAAEDITGWVVDGVAHRLRYETHGNATMFLEYPVSPDLTVLPEIRDEISHRGVFTGTDGLHRQVWIGPARAAAGATLHFAVIGLDGGVHRVTLEDGVLSGFVPVGVLPGAVSVLLDGDERRANSITNDGRVFELRVDQGTGVVSVLGLGAVRVEEPGGGYEFKGVLVDPTSPGDVYVAAIATSATTVPLYQTGMFRAHLENPPVAVVTAASLGVGAAEIDAGIAVCWPPTDAPFDGDGWTLRGEPVFVAGPVGPEGNCAIMEFDRLEAGDPAWVGAERAIGAILPGVGPVRLGFAEGRYVGHTLDPIVAARPDGSIVDARGLVLDRHGFPVSRVDTGLSSRSSSTGWATDLSGNGFWTWFIGSTTSPIDLRHVGGGDDLAAPPCGTTQDWTQCSYGGGVIGGGALYINPAPYGMTVLRLDGSVDEVPAAQASVAQAYAARVVLADGRICGLAGAPSSTRFDCVDASGATETTGLVGGTYSAYASFWPMPDGSLVSNTEARYLPSNGSGALRVDPATMTSELLDPRSLGGAISSADGRVYALAEGVDVDFNYTYDLVEVTPDGLVDLGVLPSGAAIVPIDDGILVWGPADGVHTAGWSRRPR